jgi:hypothetical protein
MNESNRFLIYILIILSFEKFIQHMLVTYAFFVDLRGIRDSVVVDYRFLMISGLVVGLFFLINIPFLYQRRRFSFFLLFTLALFDFIGEFVAQGTLSIAITVSFIVASAILIILILLRKRFV